MRKTHARRLSVQKILPCHQNLVTMNGYQWSKHAVLAALVLTSICCTVLTLQVLCKESNKKAGIATLHVRVSHYFV
jgi:hypothetical protein